MKIFAQLCCVLLLCRVAPAGRMLERGPEPHGETERRLSYRFDFGRPGRVHVELVTSSPATGIEVLQLPSRMGEASGLERAIEDLKITGTAVSLEPTPRPWLYTLRAKPGTTMQLDYDLLQDWTGLLRESERRRVLVEPEMVVFNGENGLVAPKMDGAAPVSVSFEFTGVAAGRALVTSFGQGVHQEMTGCWREVAHALFAEGSFRTRSMHVRGGEVLLAVAGQWGFSEQELALKMHTILDTERGFWRGASPAWYAVVVLPFETGSSGGAGSAFTQAFSLYLSPGADFGTPAESLAAHEAFHAWNPTALGTVVDTQRLSWFVEGVTTFYQDVMLERGGLIDAATYLSRVNAVLRDYSLSPEFHARDADLQNTLDSEEARSREPYLRGALIALWLNAAIRRQSAGRLTLDDMMRLLLQDRAQPLTDARILQTAGHFVDRATMNVLRSAIEEGGEIPIVPDSLGPCVRISQRMVWSFDLGMPASELVKGSVLREVRPESAGYGAGLRNGQVLLGWTVWVGDAEKEAMLLVREPDGATMRVRYLPRGRQVAVPQAEEVPGCVTKP